MNIQSGHVYELSVWEAKTGQTASGCDPALPEERIFPSFSNDALLRLPGLSFSNHTGSKELCWTVVSFLLYLHSFPSHGVSLLNKPSWRKDGGITTQSNIFFKQSWVHILIPAQFANFWPWESHLMALFLTGGWIMYVQHLALRFNYPFSSSWGW